MVTRRIAVALALFLSVFGVFFGIPFLKFSTGTVGWAGWNAVTVALLGLAVLVIVVLPWVGARDIRKERHRARSGREVLGDYIIRLVGGVHDGSWRILVVNSQGLIVRDDRGVEVGYAWSSIHHCEVEYAGPGKASIRVSGAESDLFEFTPLHQDGVRPRTPQYIESLKLQLDAWRQASGSIT